MDRWRLGLGMVLLATVVGCSVGGSSEPAGGPADTGAAVPGAGAKTLTTAAAGKTFTAALDPVNQRISEFGTVAEGKTAATLDMPAAQRAATRVVAAGSTLITVLVGTAWPAIVKADMDTLAREVSARVTTFRQAAAATTAADFVSALDALPTTYTGTAGVIRVKLGLPPAA